MSITVQTTISADRSTIWHCWTDPSHIVQWYVASDDWEAPSAEQDLRVGGRYTTRMQAKDGGEGFDFSGVYTEVVPYERIAYMMDDDRAVSITFLQTEGGVVVTETFDAEETHSEQMQRDGWQAILDNFSIHVAQCVQ